MSIRSELEVPLAQYAASKIPVIPVAYENRKFTKPSDGAYLEIVLLGLNAINRNLATQKRVFGKAQINIYSPLGKGMGDIEALTEEVKNLYPVLPKIGTVSIEKPCDEGNSYILDNFICVPITVSYRVEV